jgi:hypothetical protein
MTTTAGGGPGLIIFAMSGVMAAATTTATALINAAVMTGSRWDERRWVPVMTLPGQ